MTAREQGSPDRPQAEDFPIVRLLGGRNIAFSERDQAIHELDDLTAHVWRSLRQGRSSESVIADVAAEGLSEQQAAEAVNLRIQRLSDLGLSADAVDTPLMRTARQPLHARVVALAGVRTHLHLSPDLLAEVDAVLGHLYCSSPQTEFQLSARSEDDQVRLLPAGQPSWTCRRSEFVPLLKAELIQYVLDAERHAIALHAAALARGHDLLLLLGSPGAGKTTLALALSQCGYDPVADDVVLMDERSRVTGLALPFGVKAGAWPLLAENWPQVTAGPAYRRPDEQEVRFVTARAWAQDPPDRITRLLLLGRKAGAEPQLLALDPIDALAALIAEGDAPGDRLTGAAFSALVDAVENSRCERLVYSDARAAADLLSGS